MLVDFKRPTSHIKYLSSFTSDEWIKLALSNPIEILIDHAHCERKAAGVAIQLMFRYPSETNLVNNRLVLLNSNICLANSIPAIIPSSLEISSAVVLLLFSMHDNDVISPFLMSSSSESEINFSKFSIKN